jgi:DNA invertase Pin-like site-specific DNA recombinase
MNTVSYLRVSSKNQVAGDGFERQRITINHWNTTHNAAHLAEFVEEGVSGTTEIINRPALTRLVSYVLEHGNIQAIIVEKADRLARDLITNELLLRQFVTMGVKVIEAEGGNELTSGNDSNPTAVLVRQILAAVSQFEKSSIVSKLRAARNRRRAETGRCEGRKPYGHTAAEQRVVNRITELRDLPTREIAAILDAEGFPTRGGGERWRHSTVASIRNRVNQGERESTEKEFEI